MRKKRRKIWEIFERREIRQSTVDTASHSNRFQLQCAHARRERKKLREEAKMARKKKLEKISQKRNV